MFDGTGSKPDADRVDCEASRESERPLGDITDCLRDAGEGETVHVRDIVESLGRASFAAILLVPALIIVTPLSGIPGLSSVGGIIIALISLEMALGRRHVWLPGWILARGIERKRFVGALDWAKKPIGVIDRITRPRLTALTAPPFALVPEILCVACGAAMPFLELVPFSSSILASAVFLFAVALLTRDGLVVLLGLFAVAAAGGVISYFVSAGLKAI